MFEIVKFWRECNFTAAPYVHDADREIIEKSKRPQTTLIASHDAFVAHSSFGDASDSSLHLSLLPVPYQGNLETADIFVVLLNPGLGLSDYQTNADVRHSKQLMNILRQDLADVPYPFLSLNPEFAWTGGFSWWEKKLRPIIQFVAREQLDVSYAEAMQILSNRLAAIELFPYHSRNFGSTTLRGQLPSVRQAKRFVHQLLPRAKARDICIVVSRGFKFLDIEDRSLVNYDPKQARGASLGTQTTAGRAIIKFLERRPTKQ